MQKILNWLVVSSEDPTGVSLTLKGLMVSAIPTIMFLAGFAHFTGLNNDVLMLFFGYVTSFVQDSLATIGVAMTLWGFIRKIINTFIIKKPTALTAAPSVNAAAAAPQQ